MAGRDINIDNINIQVAATDSASQTIDAVIGKVNELKDSLKNTPTIKFSAKGLEGIKNSLGGISKGDAGKVKSLASALGRLSEVKIPASIGNNLKRIAVGLSQVTAAANGADIGAISSTVQNVASAATVSKAGNVADQPAQEMQGTAESTEDAANEMGRYASEADRGAKNTADIKKHADGVDKNVKKASDKAKSLTGHFKKSHGALSRLLTMVKRRVLYRAINAVISGITNGIKTGINNLYQYSKLMNGTFAKSMDTLSTESLYLKNSLGAAFAPLIEVATPYIQMVIDKFVDLLDIINQVVSRLQGKDTWTHAVKVQKEYAEASNKSTKANKELKKSILGLDEINALQDNSNNDTSSSKTSDPGYETMFVTEKMDTKKIDGIIKKLTTIWNIVKWIGIAFLGWKIAKGVGSVLGTVGSLFGMGGGASAGGGGFLAGLGKFAATIGVLTGIISALGALTLIDGFTQVLNAGAEVFVTLFKTVGRAVGAIIEGFITQISEGFPIIAENISQFMINLQPFIEGCKKIDNQTLTAVATLSDAIITLTAANFLNAIVNFITLGTSWATFGMNIVTLGGYIKQFGAAVEGISVDEVTAGANAIKALAIAASFIPNSGGFIGDIVGNNDIGEWAVQLPVAGAGLRDFSLNLDGVKPELITAGADAIKTLAEASKTIPNSGGFLGLLVGNNDIGEWTEQLPTAATGIKNFTLNLDGFKSELVEPGANAIVKLADAANKIPNSGGFLGKLVGNNDIGAWSLQLPIAGTGLKKFSENVDGMKPELVNSGAKAIKTLAKVASSIPNSGGFITLIVGDNDMGKWSESLPKVGEGLSGFSDKLTNMNADLVLAGAKALKWIAEAASMIPDSNGIFQIFSGSVDLDKWANNLPKLGVGLQGFSDSITGMSVPNVNTACECLKLITAAAKTIPNAGGMSSWFAGENNIDTFGQWLGKGRDGNAGFGVNLKKFSDDTAGIVKDNVSIAMDSLNLITDAVKKIPNAGGMSSWFAGENNIDTFGQWLGYGRDGNKGFGKNLKQFSDDATGIKLETVQTAMDSLLAITDAVKTIPNAGGMASWFAGENNIDTFGQWLGYGRNGNHGFGANLKKFFTDTDGISSTRGEELNTVLTDIIDWATQIKTNVDTHKIGLFGTALFNFASNVSVFAQSTTAVDSAFTIMFNRLLTKFETFSNRIRDGLNSLMQDMANSISSFTVSGDNSVSFNTVPTNIIVPKFYATGGFPRQGEMFVANESGAELVGQIGNRTAVANSQQIVEGIKLGVQSANDESNQLLREQNNLLASLLAKDSNVRVSDIITGLRQYNRRVGKTVIEVK